MSDGDTRLKFGQTTVAPRDRVFDVLSDETRWDVIDRDLLAFVRG